MRIVLKIQQERASCFNINQCQQQILEIYINTDTYVNSDIRERH